MNVVELVDRNAAQTPDKTALCDLEHTVTFQAVKETSERVASALVQRGLTPGSPVALMGQNSFDFVYALFGILKAGCVAVPVNHKLTAPEVNYIISDSNTALFIFDGSLAPVAQGITADIPKWSMDSRAEGFDFLQDRMEAAPAFDPLTIHDEDPAQILYTSGTTGNPKGCLHTHAGVVAAGESGARAVDIEDSDIMLVAMPIWHSSPLNNWFMGTTKRGGTIAMIREYHPVQFLQIIEKRKCTGYFGAPISYLMPLQMIPNFADYDLSSMRAWIYGGGPIAPETVKKLVAAYQSDRFFQVYGMTESGPTGIVLRPEDHAEHAGSIGCQALPGAEMRLMKDGKTAAGPGETGEIWLKAASMMQGYLNNPDATRAAFEGDWYKTGDMARMDQDGFLFIVDRIKDMIVTGGENVYSKEVEDRILEHPAVSQAAVIGTPHPDWGETVTAIIVAAPEAEETPGADDIKAFLTDRLARYKIPRIFHFAEQLPHTPSGKVMKYKLRTDFNGKE